MVKRSSFRDYDDSKFKISQNMITAWGTSHTLRTSFQSGMTRVPSVETPRKGIKSEKGNQLPYKPIVKYTSVQPEVILESAMGCICTAQGKIKGQQLAQLQNDPEQQTWERKDHFKFHRVKQDAPEHRISENTFDSHHVEQVIKFESLAKPGLCIGVAQHDCEPAEPEYKAVLVPISEPSCHLRMVHALNHSQYHVSFESVVHRGYFLNHSVDGDADNLIWFSTVSPPEQDGTSKRNQRDSRTERLRSLSSASSWTLRDKWIENAEDTKMDGKNSDEYV